jgi:KipI family sensor histidine kinase inhibitor
MTSAPGDPVVHRLADHGLHVSFGDVIDVALSRRIATLTESLRSESIMGVRDLVPSYTTLVVVLDPGIVDPKDLEQRIRELWHDPGTRSAPAAPATSRHVVIPVAYGGVHGPDLQAVARSTGLSTDEVVRRHAGADYVVGALGFVPGFAFLIGLPPELATPRRSTPRVEVPAGSVGIGGQQTGVYALPTAGGWSLIGRTPLRMFDPSREQPSLLQTGDTVRFDPIDHVMFTRMAPRERPPIPVPEAHRVKVHWPGMIVLEPGLLTSVQDLGRTGLGHIGVSPGGAVDRGALIAGNRLVGNEDGAAALEITLVGPHLRFLRPARIAITGADLGAQLNGERFPNGRARVLHPGDQLAFDPRVARVGARAYLCITSGSGSGSGSGIDVPVELGSRATDLTAGFGGLDGRALKAGDHLSWEPSGSWSPLRAAIRRSLVPAAGGAIAPSRHPFRVVRGPQADRFDDRGWHMFLTHRWHVSSKSNRVGIRLEGPLIVARDRSDLISEGMVTGSIQITGEGQPIVMLPARATIGGYPKIATVIAADLDRLGQLRPGETIRFTEVAAGT